MISLGEELTVFPFVSEEYEKNFENHWFMRFIMNVISSTFFMNQLHTQSVNVSGDIGSTIVALDYTFIN